MTTESQVVEFVSEIDTTPWTLEGHTEYCVAFGVTESNAAYVELLGLRMSSLDDYKKPGEVRALSRAFLNEGNFFDKVDTWPESVDYIPQEPMELPRFPGLKSRHFVNNPDSDEFSNTHRLLMDMFSIYNSMENRGIVKHPCVDGDRFFPVFNRDFSLGYVISEDGKEVTFVATIRNPKADPQFNKKVSNYVLSFLSFFFPLLVSEQFNEKSRDEVKQAYGYLPVLRDTLAVKVSFDQVLELLGIDPNTWSTGLLRWGSFRAVSMSKEQENSLKDLATPTTFNDFSPDMMFFLAWATLLETTRSMTLITDEGHDHFQRLNKVNPVALKILR